MIGQFKFNAIFAVLILTTCFFFAAVPSARAAFDPLKEACSQGTASTSPACQQAAGQDTNDPVAGPGGVINKAANIVALVAGVGAIIMILIGGFFYVTAGGNTENAGKARARIVSAFIGLVVVALAWVLVRLITDRVIK